MTFNTTLSFENKCSTIFAMNIIKSKLKKLIPPNQIYKVLHFQKNLPFLGNAVQKSYSGNGEDILLLQYLFKQKRDGFFVDVGAFHPKVISNTYQLHKLGWKGVNIDPNPQAINLFNKYRKKDINLQLGIAKSQEEKTYYNFSYSGANTFDTIVGEEKSKKAWNTVISKEPVTCVPLANILDKYLPSNVSHIDLLDVDVEGLDLEVLESNDWKKYRPSVVLVEDKLFKNTPGSSDIYNYLTKQGYKFYSYLEMTLIMVEEKFATS